jgi:SAM-dependent methyltransferase
MANCSGIDQILCELVRLQEQQDNVDSSADLTAFRSLVGANQYRLLYRVVRKYIDVDSAILDWGCGNGHFTYALSKLGYKAYCFAFDDSPFFHRYMSNDYELRQGNPGSPVTLPYPDHKFDAVTSVGVLEHVKETGGNEVASLQEIFRVLKPGGCFICYHFPNYFSWIEAASAFFPNKHHHRYRYTSRYIKDLCRQTGFEILEVQRYGALPRNEWGRFPQPIRYSRRIASVWDFLDRSMGYLISPLCQNYMFVARKPPS